MTNDVHTTHTRADTIKRQEQIFEAVEWCEMNASWTVQYDSIEEKRWKLPIIFIISSKKNIGVFVIECLNHMVSFFLRIKITHGCRIQMHSQKIHMTKKLYKKTNPWQRFDKEFNNFRMRSIICHERRSRIDFWNITEICRTSKKICIKLKFK